MYDSVSRGLVDALYHRVLYRTGLIKALEKQNVPQDIVEIPEALFEFIQKKTPQGVKKDKILDIISSIINLQNTIEDY